MILTNTLIQTIIYDCNGRLNDFNRQIKVVLLFPVNWRILDLDYSYVEFAVAIRQQNGLSALAQRATAEAVLCTAS
jgi:hypothetical protein